MTGAPSRRIRSWLLACLGVGCLAHPGPHLAAQSTAAGEYTALIEQYQSGDARRAVMALADREDRWVESAQASVMRAAATWPRERVTAAALLHTEVVAGGWVLPSHEPTHLNAARRFVELSRGTMVSAEFHRDWLLAVSWHLQSQMELGAALPWIDELMAHYPRDGEAVLTAGTFYETVGWSTTLPTDLPWSGASRTLSALPHRSQHDALEAAASAYRRALEIPTSHTQAAVRLGRVLAELNRADAARAVLTPILGDGPERRWRYLAALFIAVAEERAGDPRAEAAAYEQAAVLMPGCQTPLVGLTALHLLQGRAEQAAEIARTLTLRVTSCDDPWWFYRFGQPPDRLPQLLADMRRYFTP